ncbi:MAG: aldo/keto reductase [Bacteroidales bacterium]|nr:aldo/keto reductase [Bacteroidales bacterium]
MTDPVYSASENRYGQMPYRRCGRSGVLLPALSLGLWHNFGSRKPFADAKAMAHFAFDHGICHFDLANNYGPEYGTAEENFGKLMAASLRPYRDELFISSKAGWDMWPGPYGNWGSRKYLMSSLDQSLRRMNIDYVDIFYSHRWDPETPLEETMQALVDIVRQGKALYVGLSRYPVEEAAKAYRYLAERDVPCLLYQDRFNIIDRNPDKTGLIDLSKENGTGFISFSPLQQGLLTNRYLQGVPADSRMAAGTSLNPSVLTKELLQSLRRLDGIARRRGQSLAAMALSWLLRDERVTSVIIGASSVSQLQDNLKAVENLDFTEEELLEIDRLF